MAVNEEHDEQHQEKEKQAHDYIGDQVGLVELALAKPPSPGPPTPSSGPEERGHAHRSTAVGRVERRGCVRRRLGHEDQVEIRVVGGVEEDLSEHGEA